MNLNEGQIFRKVADTEAESDGKEEEVDWAVSRLPVQGGCRIINEVWIYELRMRDSGSKRTYGLSGLTVTGIKNIKCGRVSRLNRLQQKKQWTKRDWSNQDWWVLWTREVDGQSGTSVEDVIIWEG